MADSDFWGGPAPSGTGRALALAPQLPQPSSISQRSQRSLPGPAGRLGGAVRPAVSSAGSAGSGWAGRDPDFLSRPWRQALQEADVHDFDENVEPFRGNTVRAAAALQQNAVLGSLLAVVASVRRCHSGEAFVRLKDPTGAIGGTLTKAVLQAEPDLRQGAVVRLRRVTVLRTPPPRSLNHLCITLEAVVQVIPPAEGPAALLSPAYQAPRKHPQQPQEPAQQQRLAFPALPAPPAASLQPATSQQHQQPPPHQQLAGSRGAMPPPPSRQPAQLGPSSSFAWPSVGAGSMQSPQQQQQAPRQQQQQQQQRPQQGASSFAWPSIGAPAGGMRNEPAAVPHSMQQAQRAAPPSVHQPNAFGAPPGRQQQQQQQQQPAQSESVNFSLPNLNFSQEPQWRDDATSAPANQRAQAPTPASQAAGGGAAGSDWLAGLLAEADFNPFLASQGPPQPARPPLAERQPSSAAPSQQRSPPTLPAFKRQCTAAAGSALAAQRQQSPPLGSNALPFADGIDDLELDD